MAAMRQRAWRHVGDGWLLGLGRLFADVLAPVALGLAGGALGLVHGLLVARHALAIGRQGGGVADLLVGPELLGRLVAGRPVLAGLLAILLDLLGVLLDLLGCGRQGRDQQAGECRAG